MANKRVHLPFELIREILLRLPVKILLRWRCVCKSWRSLISDHNFATSHYELASSRLHTLFTAYDNAYNTLSIDFNSDVPSFNLLHLDFLSPKSYPKIGGSCRGFLLLHTFYYSCGRGSFYIWNPSTRVHKALPLSPKTSKTGYSINYLYGFTYDSFIDDYFVVLVSGKHTYPDPEESSLFDLDIFSLKSNEWKQIECDSHLSHKFIYSYDEQPSRAATIFNGAMHWFIHNRGRAIIAFHLKETRMSVIALPNDFIAYHYTEFGLLVSGGQLKTWTEEKGVFKIWVMKEYAVDSSWTKTHVFSMNPIPNGCFSILSFTNCGDILGASSNYGLVVKINDKGQLLERYSYHHPGHILLITDMPVYTDSLLSL